MAIREHAQHLLAQVRHVIVIDVVEVVDENEAPALDVLAQIRDLLLGHLHFAGFGDVRERVVEDFLAAEVDQSVRRHF